MPSRRLSVALTVLTLVLAGCAGGDDAGTAAPTLPTAPATTDAPSPPATATASPAASPTPEATTPAATPTPTATETETGTPAVWASCTHEAGIEVAYPQDWETNTGEVVPACSVFHPEPFEVPEATEVFDLAVMLSVENVPYERAASPDASVGEELSRMEAEVDGRDAVRVEVEASGDALLPDGTRSTRYVVDLGGTDGPTLIATTHGVGDLDYERNQQVLDEMMMRLAVTGG